MISDLDFLERGIVALVAIVLLVALAVCYVKIDDQSRRIKSLENKVSLIEANITAYGDSSLVVVNGNKSEAQIDLEDSIYAALDKVETTLQKIEQAHNIKK